MRELASNVQVRFALWENGHKGMADSIGIILHLFYRKIYMR